MTNWAQVDNNRAVYRFVLPKNSLTSRTACLIFTCAPLRQSVGDMNTHVYNNISGTVLAMLASNVLLRSFHSPAKDAVSPLALQSLQRFYSMHTLRQKEADRGQRSATCHIYTNRLLKSDATATVCTTSHFVHSNIILFYIHSSAGLARTCSA